MKWTPSEEQTLMDNYASVSIGELCELIPTHTKTSIQHKVSNLRRTGRLLARKRWGNYTPIEDDDLAALTPEEIYEEARKIRLARPKDRDLLGEWMQSIRRPREYRYKMCLD